MKTRIIALLIIIAFSCNLSQKKETHYKTNSKIQMLEFDCNCNFIQLKNEIETLDSLKKIVINKSVCDNPEFGVFRFDYKLVNENLSALESVKLELCDTIFLLDDKSFYQNRFLLDESCDGEALGCAFVRIRLNYD